jgi:hypothetical protein
MRECTPAFYAATWQHKTHADDRENEEMTWPSFIHNHPILILSNLGLHARETLITDA